MMQSSKGLSSGNLAAPKPSLSGPPPAAGGWAGALAPYVLTPEKFGKDVVYHYDNKIVVIFDKFPKAKHHFLLMPREIVDGFKALTSASVPMLKEMKTIADKIVKKCVEFVDLVWLQLLVDLPSLAAWFPRIQELSLGADFMLNQA